MFVLQKVINLIYLNGNGKNINQRDRIGCEPLPDKSAWRYVVAFALSITSMPKCH